MKNLFNRSASIVFGTPGASTLEVSGLRISFDITKTRSSESNKAKIELTNLSEESRNKIKELDKKITLSAGYLDGDGEEVIFVGDISRINHSYPRPEVITKIEAGDGEKVLRETVLALSYAEGFTIKEVLQDILSKIDVAEKTNITELQFTDKELSKGYSFADPFKNALDSLCDSVGLEWSFQNGQLKIQPIDSADFSRAIVLSSDSGLIDSPEELQEAGSSMDLGNKTPGWMLRALLQPTAEPGGVVSVSSREIAEGSKFKIDEVQHVGDTWGESFETKLKVFEQGEK